MSEDTNTAPAVEPVTTTENVGSVPESQNPQRFEIPDEVETQPEGSEVKTTEATATPPEKTFTQADIDRIVQKRLAEEARREERRLAEILKSRGNSAQPEANVQKDISGKPVLENYGSYEEFLEALSEWRVKESLKTAREQWNREVQEHTFKQTTDNFSKKAEAVKTEFPDWDDVALDPSLMITREMTDTILESDLGPQVLYFLGKNPTEAARISKLSPFAQAREIGKLEVKLSAPKHKTTNAPSPINPVKGQGQSETSLSESDDMKSWIKKRSRQVHG